MVQAEQLTNPSRHSVHALPPRSGPQGATWNLGRPDLAAERSCLTARGLRYSHNAQYGTLLTDRRDRRAPPNLCYGSPPISSLEEISGGDHEAAARGFRRTLFSVHRGRERHHHHDTTHHCNNPVVRRRSGRTASTPLASWPLAHTDGSRPISISLLNDRSTALGIAIDVGVGAACRRGSGSYRYRHCL